MTTERSPASSVRTGVLLFDAVRYSVFLKKYSYLYSSNFHEPDFFGIEYSLMGAPD